MEEMGPLWDSGRVPGTKNMPGRYGTNVGIHGTVAACWATGRDESMFPSWDGGMVPEHAAIKYIGRPWDGTRVLGH